VLNLIFLNIIANLSLSTY